MDTNSMKELIAKVVDEKLESKIEEHLEKSINAALNDLFGNYGGVTKVIKDKLKTTMIPHVEKYNYGDYITKLDAIIASLIKPAAPDYKKMMDNFKEFISDIGVESFGTIKMSQIFKKYCEIVAERVETSNLEIDYDESPSYELVNVSLEIEKSDSGWSYEHNMVTLQCDEDESLRFEFETWAERSAKVQYLRLFDKSNFTGISRMNEFELYLLKLTQLNIKVELDTEYMDEQVQPTAEPELTYE